MITGVLIGIAIVVTIFIIAVFVFKGSFFQVLSGFIRRITDESIKSFEERFKSERERLSEQFETKMELNKKEMESKKDLILQTVKDLREQIDISQKTGVSLKTVIEEHKNITQSLQMSTENLRNVLSNNQMRGSWGEEVAEDLLRTAGFVRGESYTSQTQQDTNTSRPDLTIFLPDKTKLHIDVKFPFQSLQRYQESEGKSEQDQHLKQFSSDIKNKVKQITSRDYINPEENTVDFALMFIPNEMIFSFIYEKYPDLWRNALRQKVVMAGPFSFVAILRMIKQSYDNFKYQKNVREIINQIRLFEKEYQKFSEALDTLGNRIESVSKQYNQVATTRDRQLSKVVDRVKSGDFLLESGEGVNEQIEEVIDPS